MGKSAVKSVRETTRLLRSSVAVEGGLRPQNSQNSDGYDAGSTSSDSYLCPRDRRRRHHALLDGNFVRRTLPLKPHEYCIWDTELPGFGLRISPTGRYYWTVRLRHRGKQRRVSLGRTDNVDAELARAQARRLLAEVALDGLPKRPLVRETPTMTDYVATYWPDLARGWKASTAKRNLHSWKRYLEPQFGSSRVAEITRADIQRWRDGCIDSHETAFNRSVPVLAALLKYAEALQFRRKNSNPCKGMPRYKREAKERFLTPQEYRRLARELALEEAAHPKYVAIIRLLIFTGARVSEIRDLRWDWVRPPRLMLPDSKTGPKIIWLNSQALAVLAAQSRAEGHQLVFPNQSGTGPVTLKNWWPIIRRRCALPDVRLHDLRHSFASVAIMDQVPLATIGKLLGHALTETTARYAHLADDTIADAAQRVSGSLANALGLRA